MKMDRHGACRLKSCILILSLMLMLFLCTAANAETILEGSCGEGVRFVLNSFGTLKISGSGAITEHPWTDGAYCERVSRVQIGSGITGIGEEAFAGCENMVRISIPESVSEIGYGAFLACGSLESLQLPSTMASIGASAFEYCTSLTKINLPSGITEIGTSTFQGCVSLTAIEIPEGVQSLGYHAFRECAALKSVSLPDGLESIGYSVFQFCPKLQGIEIPRTVTSILDNAFQGCSALTEMDIPDRVGVIGNALFKDCTGLTRVSLPTGLSGIGEEAFKNCALTEVAIPDSVQQIGARAFENCRNLAEIQIPKGVTRIEPYTFYGCRCLEEATIPSTAVSIGESAFESCSSLWHAEIQSGVEYLGESAFRNCGRLSYVILPDGIKEIADHAFMNCGALDQVTIPSSVVRIGEGAFQQSSLRQATILAGITDLENDIFNGCGMLSRVQLPASLRTIGDRAFNQCNYLTEIKIPTGVTRIGERAFYSNWKLGNINLPTALTQIGPYAFYGCSSLVSVEIPSGVSDISDDAFAECANLFQLKISNGVSRIGNRAFYNCDRLASVTLPSSVTDIGGRAFGSSSSVPFGIYVPDSVLTIGYNVFRSGTIVYCDQNSNVQSMSFGPGVTVAVKGVTDPDSIRILGLPREMILLRDTNAQIEYTVFPTLSNPQIDWSSTNDDVASVENGILHAYSAGECTIFASLGSASASMYVRVENNAQSFTMEPKEVWTTVNSGGVLFYTYGFMPDRSKEEIVWTSSNNQIAHVNGDGRIVPHKTGDVTVYATLPNGAFQKGLVHICAPVKSVKFEPLSQSVNPGDTVKLNAIVTTKDGNTYTNKLISLNTNSWETAEINGDGILSAKDFGVVKITAEEWNNYVAPATDTIWVNVGGKKVLQLPENIKRIENSAFEGSDCEIVVIPFGCEQIGSRAFANCKKLLRVMVPGNVNIASDALSGSTNARIVYTY